MAVKLLRLVIALLVAYVVLDMTLALILQDEHPGLIKSVVEILTMEAGKKEVIAAFVIAAVAGVLAYKYIKC